MRSKRVAQDRVAPSEHLVNRIFGQSGRVVAVGVAQAIAKIRWRISSSRSWANFPCCRSSRRHPVRFSVSRNRLSHAFSRIAPPVRTGVRLVELGDEGLVEKIGNRTVCVVISSCTRRPPEWGKQRRSRFVPHRGLLFSQNSLIFRARLRSRSFERLPGTGREWAFDRCRSYTDRGHEAEASLTGRKRVYSRCL